MDSFPSYILYASFPDFPSFIYRSKVKMELTLKPEVLDVVDRHIGRLEMEERSLKHKVWLGDVRQVGGSWQFQ